MNYENPAARLADILDEGSKAKGNENAASVWSRVLDSGQDQALLLSRLGKVMELPSEIIQELVADHPDMHDTWAGWSSPISAAFHAQQLGGQWQTFLSHISPSVISNLKLTAKVLDNGRNLRPLPPETLTELRAKFDELYAEIIQADIPDDLRRYLAFHLRRLRKLIDEYRITGATPIRDAIFGAIGDMAATNSADAVKGAGVGRKFLELLAATANATTIVANAPALAQIANSLLDLAAG